MPNKRTSMTLICAHCASEFVRWKWHRSQVPKYCSPACILATRSRRPLADRLWEKVVKTDTCWLKQGATAGHGEYGVIWIDADRRQGYTHVVAWWLATGHWPMSGQAVCHTCDTPRCCRNDDAGTYEVDGVLYERHGHLWLGTDKANALDKMAKGRAPQMGDGHWSRQRPESIRRGEQSPRARLTTDLVREIRQKYSTGATSLVKLGKEYNIAPMSVHRLVTRKTWAHIV